MTDHNQNCATPRRVRVTATPTKNYTKPRRQKRRHAPANVTLPPTLAAWEALTPLERATRTGSHTNREPFVSSPRPKHVHRYRLHCGHAYDPAYEVHVVGTTAFLCFECFERARNTHHRSGRGDAMRLAVERAPKPR